MLSNFKFDRTDGYQMTIVEPGASYDAGGIFDFVKVKK